MSVALDMGFRYDAAVRDESGNETAPHAEIDDILLANRARSGDIAAFEELVRRYRNQVYALSHHFVRNREEAWDISQEVFIKAHRYLGGFRAEASFKSWLLRIAANHCKDHLKRRRIEAVSLDESIGTDAPATGGDPGQNAANAELARAIDTAVASLPEIHQTAFILREYQGMSYEEMAQTMGCNLGTVMSRLHHARKKLQNALIRMGVVEG